ncbi:MAG: hypothetical protein QXX08_05065 [Candidatus Bathyarchaeia archaeon]
MKAIKAVKKVLYILLTGLLLLTSQFLIIGINSAYAPLNENNSESNPDTLIRGIVKKIQYEYKGNFLGGTYKLPALITVILNETIMKSESFTREINQLVDVSYNYSVMPKCRVSDVIEVYGLWVSLLDVSASLTILVGGNVNGSYLRVVSSSSPLPPSEDNGQDTASINTQSECSNGSIPLGPGMNLWYTWINTSETQVAFFTYYSEVYNSPIQTFLGSITLQMRKRRSLLEIGFCSWRHIATLMEMEFQKLTWRRSNISSSSTVP